MRAARADSNQEELVNAFRGLGCTVFSLHRVGNGCPDLLVGIRGSTALVEVKRPAGPKGGLSGSQLTPDQIAFRASWKGAPVHIVRTLTDVGALVKALEGIPHE